MKWGLNLLCFTTHAEEAHRSLLPLAKGLDFDGLEFPVGRGDEAHYTRWRNALADEGLAATAVFALGPDADPIDPSSQVRARAMTELRLAFDRASALGADLLCGPFHSAFKRFSGQGPTADELSRSADFLHAAGEVAQAQGLRLALEHLQRFECYLVNTARQCRDLVDAARSDSVGILYDTYHAYLEEDCSDGAIETCGDKLFHVHLSESHRGVPGRGQVDFRARFESLLRAGYDGWLVIEAFTRADPAFAADVHVWRERGSGEEVAGEGGAFLRRAFEEAQRAVSRA